jgi:uncharacterized protein
LGKKNVIAVTAKSSTYPSSELKEAKKIAWQIGAKQIFITSEELNIPGFKDNPLDSCYFCKKELFGKLKALAESKGINFVIDGTNADDQKDYRPGMTAAKELGVVSPLKEAKLTKTEIRNYSKKMGLPTWNKPSLACLASRFPHGEGITKDKLIRVNRAEDLLRKEGFSQVRVRHHGNMARIEVIREELTNFNNIAVNKKIVDQFKKIGFKYISLDLEGYRSGSMNP